MTVESVEVARPEDVGAITAIYNEGIRGRHVWRDVVIVERLLPANLR